MEGIIALIIRRIASHHETMLEKLYMQSLLIFYQGMFFAIQRNDADFLRKRVLDVKLEPVQLWRVVGKNEATLDLYLKALAEIKTVIK